MALAFSPDSKRLVTGSHDTFARVWDVETGSPLSPPLVHGGIVTDVAFDSTGELFVTACEDGFARLWSGDTYDLSRLPIPHGSPVQSCAFSPARRFVATGCKDGALRFIPLAARVPDVTGEDLNLWVEVKTGLTETPDGDFRRLTQEEWMERVEQWSVIAADSAVEEGRAAD